jgi:RsiW-degrading membrane proteinase PrsW (M82 family)
MTWEPPQRPMDGLELPDLTRADAVDPETFAPWWALFLLATALNVPYLISYTSGTIVAAATLLAVAPLSLILLSALALQSHRPEPALTRLWSFAWGACIAATIAGFTNSLVGPRTSALTIVIAAPITEELLKGAGLLLLVRWRRLRNPLDGIVHALYVAGGFAFLENVFYFTEAIALDVSGETRGGTVAVFLMRGVVSPLAHPLFTAVIGLGVGLAAAGAARWRVLLPAAVTGAIVLHGTWNYFAFFSLGSRAAAFFAPATAVAVVVTVALTVAERRRYRRHAHLVTGKDRVLLDMSQRDRRTTRAGLGVRARHRFDVDLRAAYREAARTRDWYEIPPDPAERAGRSTSVVDRRRGHTAQ